MIHGTETQQIRDAIDATRKGLQSKPSIVEVRFDLGEDSTGDPAVFVLALLDDETRDEDWTSTNLDPIADRLTEAVVATGVGRLVYVRFARPSDLPNNGAGA